MNKVTRKKTSKYTTISNGFLRDKNLSLKAKGFLTVIMALPDDWDFSIKGICSVLKEGKTAIYGVIQELKENRYCKTTPNRNEKGLILGLDYVFYEEPYDEEPQQDYPHSDNRYMDNMPQLNTYENKENKGIKDLSKKEERDKSLSKKSFDFLSALLSIGVEEQIAKDWMKIRTSKKASDSETAFKQLKTALESINNTYRISATDAISICVTNGWYGCKPSYFENIRLDDYGFGTQTSLSQQNNGKDWQ